MHEMIDFRDRKAAKILIIFCGSSMIQEKGFQWYLESIEGKKISLDNVYYMVLSLGDSNLPFYQGASRALSKQLSRLGANKFCADGEADESKGQDYVVDPWFKGSHEALVRCVKDITTFSTAKMADIFKKAFALRFVGKVSKIPDQKFLTGQVNRVRHICALPDKRVEEA